MRVEVFLTFVKIAKRLEYLRSYNSLYAVVHGLQHPTIWGLIATLRLARETDPDLFDTLFQLANVTSSTNSFHNYHAAFKFSNPPCVPLVKAISQRLLDQSELGSQPEDELLIDISYLIQMGDTLALFDSFKMRSHTLPENPLLQIAIMDCVVMDYEHCRSKSDRLAFDGEKESRSGIDGYSSNAPSVWFD